MITKEEFSAVLSRIGKKAMRIGSIQLEAALLDDPVDVGSPREVAAMLRSLGWVPHNTGGARVWIAPGETAVSVGLLQVKNVPMAVAKAVKDFVGTSDTIEAAELFSAVKQATGLDFNETGDEEAMGINTSGCAEEVTIMRTMARLGYQRTNSSKKVVFKWKG